MNLLRTLGGPVLFVLTGAVLNGCISPPEYPVKPAIDFKEVKVNRIPAGTQTAVDELTFVLEFRDGDGDLGLSDEDKLRVPYNQPPPPTVPQRNQAGNINIVNYFIQPFLKDPVTGQFTQFVNSPPIGKIGEYDGTFPRLDVNQTKAGPLRGELNYTLPVSIDGSPFLPGQVFRFEITIMDRALNVSNTVTTSEVTLSR